MGTFWTLYKKEVGSYFISTVAYIALFASALCVGGHFTVMFNYLAMSDIREYTILEVCVMGVFFWVVLVQVPLVTMRSFSEEFKLGTIEMLMTAPVTEWQVVLAKYLAALTFFVVLWTPLYLDVQLLAWLTNGRVPVIWPLAGMTFLGLFLAGMFYVSVGVFTSILTRNQIVAAVLSFGILFFYFMFGFVSYVVTSEPTKNFISYFMVFEHMRAWTIGLFDTRPMVLYVSGTLFFLLLTQRLLLARRLRG